MRVRHFYRKQLNLVYVYTIYTFTAEGIGGSFQSFGNFDQFAENYSAWVDSFNEDEAYSVLVDIPVEGLIAIWDLLPSEYSDEVAALDATFNSLAESEYSLFLSQFMKSIDDGDYVNFAGGTGTAKDPYKISTVDHLRNIDNFLSDGIYFRLLNDIDVTSKYSNWMPIGASSGDYTSIVGESFQGDFDGGGYTITYEITSYDNYAIKLYLGLFGHVKNATISDLNVQVNIAITGWLGDAFTGGVAGWVDNSVIEDCSVTGSISTRIVPGTPNTVIAGGVVGNADNSQIKECTNSASVDTKAEGVAG